MTEELTSAPPLTDTKPFSETRLQNAASTLSIDNWTVADIAKAAGLLHDTPPTEVEYESEEEMRRVYSLIYDALRYRSVLTEALNDSSFFGQYPEEKIVILLLYDLHKRRFLPRDTGVETLAQKLFGVVAPLPAVDAALWSSRVRLAAALARIRIKNNALHLSSLLPRHLADCSAQETFVTGWLNSCKTRESLTRLMDLSGLRPVSKYQEFMNANNYQLDPICPKFVLCHPDKRAALLQSQSVRQHCLILQDRSFCLGPAVLSRVLQEYKLCGNVVQTHIASPRSVAYLANILTDNENIGHLLAFGADDKKEEYECYLSQLGVRNVRVYSQKYVDVPAAATLLEGVVGVLATPPNTYSGVSDPVDLVCSRGGDMAMLEILTDVSGNTGCKERVATILDTQRQTLRHSMSKPETQVVVYVTHSVLSEENELMAQRMIEEMNQSAWERHAEDAGVRVQRDVDAATPQPEHPRSTHVKVPACDLFEMELIPSVCLDPDATMQEEGAYLALLQRQEIVRLDSMYMIQVAESRGLFGDRSGRETPAKKPRSTAKKTPASASPRPAPQRRRKVELDRIAAPTLASILRCRAMPCIRHEYHASRALEDDEPETLQSIPSEGEEDSEAVLATADYDNLSKSQWQTSRKSFYFASPSKIRAKRHQKSGRGLTERHRAISLNEQAARVERLCHPTQASMVRDFETRKKGQGYEMLMTPKTKLRLVCGKEVKNAEPTTETIHPNTPTNDVGLRQLLQLLDKLD